MGFHFTTPQPLYNTIAVVQANFHVSLDPVCVITRVKGIGIYFILYSENQCISKLDEIGIFIDIKFH